MDFKQIAPHVMDSFDLLLSSLAAHAGEVKKQDQHMLKAAQAIAVIAMADQFLASMPVEVALQYRQIAKEFNTALEEKWGGPLPKRG